MPRAALSRRGALYFHKFAPFITYYMGFYCYTIVSDGSIRVGDRIVAINGVTVITALLEQAQRLIRECHSVAHLVIEYDIAVMG